ncbi:MAG: ABC transporter ATP-binding protein [Clostridia bacterium]|nr:ABC transporter ATP-binding protein [Clostridia bacterium]
MEQMIDREKLLVADRVTFAYKTRHQTVWAVRDVSYEFEAGKVYAIVGKSGCGKTTLISTLAGLNLPSMGEVYYRGTSTYRMNRNHYRRDDIAVIYQNYNLFPLLTVLENVLYPMELQKKPKKDAVSIAKEKLLSVGLDGSYLGRLPAMLSGGEQQRVAIARALAGGQRIILADEPTGNLDSENGDLVMKTFQRLAHEEGYCVIIVTHDPQIADESDIVIRMESGRIVT